MPDPIQLDRYEMPEPIHIRIYPNISIDLHSDVTSLDTSAPMGVFDGKPGAPPKRSHHKKREPPSKTFKTMRSFFTLPPPPPKPALVGYQPHTELIYKFTPDTVV